MSIEKNNLKTLEIVLAMHSDFSSHVYLLCHRKVKYRIGKFIVHNIWGLPGVE